MILFYLVLILDHVNGAAIVVMPKTYPLEQCEQAAKSLPFTIKTYCVPAPH